MQHTASLKKTEFFHKDVLGIFPSIKPRTLISWVEEDLIQPLSEPVNRGGKRVYSYENLMEIGFVNELLMHGLRIKIIRDVINDKKFVQLFHQDKREYKKIFIQEFRPITSFNAVTKRRVQERRWPLEWYILPFSKLHIYYENLPNASLSSAIIVNIRRLKIYIDDGLKALT